MRTRIIGLALLSVVAVLAVYGFSSQKASFKVSGKCGMCESRIEKAAMSVKGVESAEWDKETGMIALEYGDKADLDRVQKAIAKAGHDTELYTANDKVYEKLPECCKYERVEAKASACCPGAASTAPCGSSSSSCSSSASVKKGD